MAEISSEYTSFDNIDVDHMSIENTIGINNIKAKLETIKEKQPNLYKLWKLNIYQNEAKLIKSLIDCNTMLDNIDMLTKKLTMADIQTFVILNKCGYK